MKILCFSHLCIDTNTTEHASYTAPGGPGLFMHKLYRQLHNVDFTVVASYGPDFLLQTEELRDKLFPDKPNLTVSLQYRNVTGENSSRIWYAENREKAVPVPIDGMLAKRINEADGIIISPLLPNFTIDYMQTIRKHAGPKTPILLLPQGYFRAFTKENRVIAREFTESNAILPLVDILLVSHLDPGEMHALAPTWNKTFHLPVIETEGEDGAYLSVAGKTVHIPTNPVKHDKIVDSVGAGDTFAAALFYWYLETKNLTQAVTFAHHIARQKLFFTSDKIQFNIQEAISAVTKENYEK